MSKLTDKAKGISFDDVDDVVEGAAATAAPSPAPVPQARAERPRTAIGAISASLALGRGVEAQNRELQARLRQFEDAVLVELIDPQRIVPSRFANRHELSFAGPAFEVLKAEIQSAGRNVQPIKVRPIPVAGAGAGSGAVAGSTEGRAGQGAQYEIVFGHRRHRACLELGLPVAAVIEPLSDAQLFAEMERENRARDDLSAWEQGAMYKRALDLGLFKSQRQLAVAIGAQSGNVSTAIQIASLPSEVVQAFRSPMELQYRWGAALKAALDKDAATVLAAARALAGLAEKLPGKDVVARLTGATAAPAAVARVPEPPVALRKGGRTVGAWERDAKGGWQLRLDAGALSDAQARQVLDTVSRLLAD